MDLATLVPYENLTEQQLHAAVAAVISVGTLYCFLGYRTLKFLIALTGFLLAGGVAGILAGLLSEGHGWVMLVSAGLGGLAGAMALFFLYRAGVFCLGLLGGVLIAHNALAGSPETWAPLAVLGIGVAAGLIAIVVERPVVTATTAALGAWIVVWGVAYFLLGEDWLRESGGAGVLQQERKMILGAWIVLSIAGAMAQFATHKRTAPPGANVSG